jgi:hypothetical protein
MQPIALKLIEALDSVRPDRLRPTRARVMTAPSPSPPCSSASWRAAPQDQYQYQSITELLQTPAQDLADAFLPGLVGPTSAAAAAAATGSAINPAAAAPPVATIKDFAPSLTDVVAPYRTFLETTESATGPGRTARIRQYTQSSSQVTSSQKECSTQGRHQPHDTSFIPPAYFSNSFSLASSSHLASLHIHLYSSANFSSSPQVASLRQTLATYQSALEASLHTELTAASAPLAADLSQIHLLRAASASAAFAAASTASVSAHLPAATAPGTVQIHSLILRVPETIGRPQTC